jgi:hypothetical protein
MNNTQIYENEQTTEERVAHEYNNAQPQPTDKRESKIQEFTPLLDKEGKHRISDGPFGIVYFFTVTMVNGDKGSVGSKSEFPTWKFDCEYEYSVQKNGNYTNFKGFKKVGAPNFFPKAPQQVAGSVNTNAQCALNAAVAYATARIEKGIDFKASHCLKLAEQFNAFLEQKA